MDACGARRIRSGLAAALGASVALAALAGHADDAPHEGARLYATLQCAGCHEYAEIPGFEVIPLSGLGERYDEAGLAALLAEPPDAMPRFPLDEDERRSLARHLRERFP